MNPGSRTIVFINGDTLGEALNYKNKKLFSAAKQVVFFFCFVFFKLQNCASFCFRSALAFVNWFQIEMCINPLNGQKNLTVMSKKYSGTCETDVFKTFV